ncbi:MAG: phage tail sheath family protein, partial [Sporomusa sp.]
MAFKHGVFPKEIPTAILPPSQLADGVPVFIGTAPIQQVEGGLENANTAIYCSNKTQAVAQLGYSDDWKNYTLCEAMYAAFDLYGIAPVIFINVLDPREHKKAVTGESIKLVDGKAALPNGVMLDTLKVKSKDGLKDYQKNADYLTSYADDGTLQLIVVPTGAITSDITSLTIDCTKLDPASVTKANIIGGIDINTGKREGIEVISEIFLRYNKIPGYIGAPGYADDSEVGAVLTAKGYGINGVFKAQQIALDINTTTCKKYSDVPAAKKALNFVDPLQTVCWPMGKLGDKVFHGSTIAICRKALTDYNNDGVPFESPSNKTVQIDAAILADKTQLWLDLTDANYLNENGVV